MKVAYVGGYWATNVGNAFFNIGADYVLKQVFGEENVHIVFDHPAGIIRSKKKYGNPKRALNLIKNYDVDAIVLLGPVLSRDFLKIWEETIKDIIKKGRRYMILSCGIMKCSPSELTEIKKFLKKYPPMLITTRDRDAYNLIQESVENIYDGIDFAFFVPDAYKPVSLDFEKILTLNFDKFFEPRIKTSSSITKRSTFYFDNKYWELKFNRLTTNIGAKTDRLTDALVYMLSVFPAKDRMTMIDGYNIIRPDHRFTPMMKNKVFRYSNSFVADIPYSYIDIYASSDLTLSDRVHACAITLAYGNSAMFFSKTNRSKLLDRVGATEIYNKPVKIDLDWLSREKSSLINWLKSII